MNADPAPAWHKDAIHRLYAEVWTEANFDNIAEFIAPLLHFHFRGETFEQTPESLVQIVKRWKDAFPDIRFEVEQVVAEGDLAAVRLVYRGTHEGVMKGLAPTGREVEVREMVFLRFKEGKIAEVWEVADEYALRQQLTGESGEEEAR